MRVATKDHPPSANKSFGDTFPLLIIMAMEMLLLKSYLEQVPATKKFQYFINQL